jgi:hypothetical protein
MVIWKQLNEKSVKGCFASGIILKEVLSQVCFDCLIGLVSVMLKVSCLAVLSKKACLKEGVLDNARRT